MQQTLNLDRRDTKESLQGVHTKLRDVKVHMGDLDNRFGDLEAWKQGVETQLGNLAQQVPRPQGQLPGRPEENPRGHIAAINLRSGRNLPDITEMPSEGEEDNVVAHNVRPNERGNVTLCTGQKQSNNAAAPNERNNVRPNVTLCTGEKNGENHVAWLVNERLAR